MKYQCIVCGAVLNTYETTLAYHRDTAHTGVKKSIPLAELYREHIERETP